MLLAQAHTASIWERQDLNPGMCDFKTSFFNRFCRIHPTPII